MAKDTPETLAAKLREAQKLGGLNWLNVISDHVDLFDMRHEPPTPLDGPTTGEQVRKLNDYEIEAFGKAFPDGSTVTGPVIVDGNDVTTDFTLTGVLADGTKVVGNSRTVWTTKDGRIVACIARSIPVPGQPDTREQMMKALANIGSPIPSAADLGMVR